MVIYVSLLIAAVLVCILCVRYVPSKKRLSESTTTPAKSVVLEPLAETTEVVHYIPELDMIISFPIEMMVITRKTQKEKVTEFGLKYEETKAFCEDKDIYAVAFAVEHRVEHRYEVITTMTYSRLNNSKSLSSDELLKQGLYVKEDFERSGVTFIGCDIYENQQAKFLKIQYTQEANARTEYCTRYSTIAGGKLIDITLHSLDVHNKSNADMIRQIVDSAKLEVKPKASRHTDQSCGVSFNIPSDWSAVSNDGKNSIIRLAYDNSPNLIFELYALNNIGYASYSKYDAYEELASSEQFGDARFTTVNYEDKAFIQMSHESKNEKQMVSTVQLFYLNKEWLYMFYFLDIGGGSPTDSPAYRDFEALLCSVEFPQ